MEVRLDVHLPVRAQRHAQLPAQRLRAHGRRHAHRADDALRRGDGSRRQPHLAPLGSARLPEGAGADAALLRRPPRAASCMVRAGFKQWVEAGLPARRRRPAAARVLQARPGRVGARHARRGGRRSSPRRSKNIAETYTRRGGHRSGSRRSTTTRRSIEATQGAGTQVLKFRGGMPLLGITRVFGMYRMANSMALLDAKIRKRRPRPGARRRAASTTTPGTPICRPATRWSPASRRSSSISTPSSTRKTRGRLGHELDHDQDARRALADRGAAQGHASRRDRLRVLGHRDQGRRRDRRAARARRRRWRWASRTSSCARSSTTPTTCKRWTDLPLLVRMDTLKYLRAAGRLRRRSRRR